MLKGNSTLKELDLSSNYCWNAGATDGPGFAQELADGIKDNGAMTSLNVSNNLLCGHWKTPNFSGFKALGKAIEQHKLLTMDAVNMSEALDVSGQNLGAEGAEKIAIFIKDNGAMSSFTFGVMLAVTMTTAMLEANFSGKLRSYEAQIVAAFLPKCT
jgi:hypothetical protein